MPIPTIHGQAGLTEDPTLRFTQSGKAVLSLRFAFNDSKFNDQTRQWETTRTLYLDGSAWEQTAERLSEQLRKGDQVYVEGRLETQQWEHEGQKRSKPHLIVRTAKKFEKAQPQQQSGGFQQQQQAPPPAGNQQASAFGQMSQGQDVWGGGQQQQAGPAPF